MFADCSFYHTLHVDLMALLLHMLWCPYLGFFLCVIKIFRVIIQYSGTMYRDHEFLSITQNQCNIHFIVTRQYWLGMAKPPSGTLSSSYYEFYVQQNCLMTTDWLTNLLMLSDKGNLIMAIATGLISSLFNVALSQYVPFCQLQQFHCLHHGSTIAHLCSPLSSIPFSFHYCVVNNLQTCACDGFSARLGGCIASKGTFFSVLHLKLLEMAGSLAKWHTYFFTDV